MVALDVDVRDQSLGVTLELIGDPDERVVHVCDSGGNYERVDASVEMYSPTSVSIFGCHCGRYSEDGHSRSMSASVLAADVTNGKSEVGRWAASLFP